MSVRMRIPGGLAGLRSRLLARLSEVTSQAEVEVGYDSGSETLHISSRVVPLAAPEFIPITFGFSKPGEETPPSNGDPLNDLREAVREMEEKARAPLVPSTISDKQAMTALGMAMTLPDLVVPDGNLAEELFARLRRQVAEESDQKTAAQLASIRVVEAPWMPENTFAFMSPLRDPFPPMKFDLELTQANEMEYRMTSRAHMPFAIPRVFLPLDIDDRKPPKRSRRQCKQMEVRAALAKRRARMAKRRRR